MPGPAEIAISGCGAVTETYYVEALAQLRREGRVRAVRLFDADPGRALKLAGLVAGARAVSEFDGLIGPKPDLLVIASPPQHHLAQAVAALRQGVPVLCEKPIAATAADAQAMLEVAAATGGLLAAAMIRRHLPATLAVKRLLATGLIGELQSIEVFEGGKFRWPIASPAYFQRSQSGGGVLLDIGIHALDLLAWWLGELEPVSCEDDAMGGIEANVRLRFRRGTAAGEVRLSRDWHRPNHYTIRGAEGSIRWIPPERDALMLSIDGLGDYTLKYARQSKTSFIDDFARQMRDVLDAIEGKPAAVLTVGDALVSLRLVEAFYRRRSLAAMPWLGEREHAAAVVARTA